MKTPAKLALFVLLFVFSTAELAIARKAVRIPDSIRPPDRIVMVIDLPDTEDFKSGDTYVDLGYLHHNSSSGEWVGYVGSTSRFIGYSEAELKELLQKANIAELPPAPGYFGVGKGDPRQPAQKGNTAVSPLGPSYYGGWLDKYDRYLIIPTLFLALGALSAVVKVVFRSRNFAPEPGQVVTQTPSVPTRMASSYGTPPGGARATFGKRL